MKKIINYVLVSLVMVLFFSTVVYATDINMNLEIQSGSNSTSNEVSSQNVTSTLSQDSTPQQSTTVSSVASVSEDTFGMNEILNIFLIVVGVILVLLGIAVLIRLK